MVMDLQDVNETLEDVVARSRIRLLGSSSKNLIVDPSSSLSADDRLEDEDEEGSDDEDGGGDEGTRQ